MDNPFAMPQGAGLPPDQQMPQQAPQSAPDPLAHVEALYSKARESQQTLAKVKNGLDHLVTLGDTVTVEDVVQTAGKLIGGNITPEGMASLLASMPDGNPEQLMMWIGERDQDITKRIAQTEAMTKQLRQEMGSLAIGKLGGAAQVNQAEQQQPEASPPEGGPQMTSNVANSMGL